MSIIKQPDAAGRTNFPARVPFEVRVVGHIDKEPYHSTRGTWFDHVMLTVIRSGSGYYYTGNTKLKVEKGMVGMVLPSQDPGILFSNPEDPYDHYHCRFTGKTAYDTAKRIILKHSSEPFFYWERWPELVDILEPMCIPRGEINLERRTMLPDDARLALLLATLETPPVHTSHILSEENLRHYMVENRARPINLAYLADHFGVSKEHVCRKAKVLLNANITKVWQELKISWAAEILTHTKISINEICMRVGMQNRYYFSTVFKKIKGIGPAAWRRMHRKF
jgi:AraC-like DNA-binding protein